MSRFDVPTREQVPAESQQIFDQIEQKFGTLPNLYAVLGLSPVALQGLLQFQPALEESSLEPREVQALHLATSQENGCDYCLAAHTMLGTMAGLDQATTVAIRRGEVEDPRLRAASDLARDLVRNRGKVSDDVADAFFDAGFDKRQFVDAVALVGAKTISNYMHNAVDFPVDFPEAPALETATR